MRRPILFALAAVIVLLAGATVAFFMKYQQSTANYVDMKSKEEAARDRYGEAFNAIAEIQDSLNTIAVGDTTVQMVSQEVQAGERLTEPRRRETLERIALLKASVERSKQRLAKLEANLRHSGIKINGLEKMIANLKQSVSDKEAMVAQLTSQVNDLQTQVAGLQNTVQQDQDTLRVRDQTIEEKRRALATVFYKVDTKRNLAQAGVIEARGGVLGLGKTLKPSGRFDTNEFTALDTDQEQTIHTGATKLTKVQVLTPQPPSSYQLELVAGQVDLHITDPERFRQVKELVVMTK